MRLLTPRERALGYHFKFEMEGLLRADIAARTAALEKQFQNGVLSRDEWRKLENRNPVPGGDLFALSQNLKMLDANGQPIQPVRQPETKSQSQDETISQS
jgi:phage portal protein BeeE